ncbi:enoyl-CoA hydratase-related protein [Chloroflexota bacterium]
MKYRHIIYQPGKVARVILNRPRYLNAQSRILLEEMDDAFSQAVADDEVRIIVLSGEGDHFSAGHDLSTQEELADRQERGFPADGEGSYKRRRNLFFEKTLRWRNLEKPTVAMVQGYCIFGGWMIAAAMDIIYASEDAIFLPSHFQYFSTPWDIGPRKAKEILFEHRFITAQEAYEQHFVNYVYPRDRLEEETLAYANRVAEHDPFRVRLTKSSINHMMDTMGFTAELEAAYQTYFVLRYLEENPRIVEGSKGKPLEGKGIAQADVALRHLKQSLKGREA